MESLILLDIDGVINVSDVCPADGWTGHLLLEAGRGAYVEVRDDLPELLGRLEDAGELVWATGWEDTAGLLLSKLVPWLDTLPHLTFEHQGKNVFKLPVIREYVGDRPTVWIDDLIPDDAWAWAETRGAPTLLVHIDPKVGLSPDDVTMIEEWTRSVAAASEADDADDADDTDSGSAT
jgi:hypothetical protein